MDPQDVAVTAARAHPGRAAHRHRRRPVGHRSACVGLVAASFAAPAFASHYQGADWALLFVFYTLPFALIPIGLSLLLAAFGLFRKPAFGTAYMLIAALVACGFLLVAFNAPGGFATIAIVSIEVLVVLALTLLPPWIQRRTAAGASREDPGSNGEP